MRHLLLGLPALLLPLIASAASAQPAQPSTPIVSPFFTSETAVSVGDDSTIPGDPGDAGDGSGGGAAFPNRGIPGDAGSPTHLMWLLTVSYWAERGGL